MWLGIVTAHTLKCSGFNQSVLFSESRISEVVATYITYGIFPAQMGRIVLVKQKLPKILFDGEV